MKLIKGERRDQKRNRAYRKVEFGKRNNRKALEVLLQAQRHRIFMAGGVNKIGVLGYE